MTLDQLRVFIEVAERGHMTRAAEALGMSQSAASAAVAALENYYQIKLFDRIGRGIRLTRPGQIFLREARAVLDRASMARSVLQDLAGSPAGPVDIAASQTIATYWLPRRLASFHAANPRVRLNVMIRNTNEVEHAVVEGEVSIGLVEGPTQHPALIRQQIDHDQIVLVVASGRPPLPVIDSGRLDLRAINWVIREAGSGTRRALEDLASKEDLTLDDLNIFLVLPSNEAVREAIEAGAGATIVSRHVVASAIAAGKLTEIPIELPQREYALVRHRDRHATLAQQTLVSHLTEDIDQDSPLPEQP
ncbi:LysR substrate-binding domain-containing protein [Microbaculum sp. FT89]|uniref:LysR substrate-binding domain-containing protein n=1 Tax=Microbaculum sp. FT89 TaxID=3447298 RepID=UPI003F5302BD